MPAITATSAVVRRASSEPNPAAQAAVQFMQLIARKSRSSKKGKKKLKAGPLVGIIIGIIVVLIIIAVILFLLRKRAQKKKLQGGHV